MGFFSSMPKAKPAAFKQPFIRRTTVDLHGQVLPVLLFTTTVLLAG